MVKPAVTVIIPTRDRWSMATRAARCALEQREVPNEVIVVDDGSVEQAPRGRLLSDERVRVVRRKAPRAGPPAGTTLPERLCSWAAAAGAPQ